MTDPQPSSVGKVWSADIAVPDHAKELRFYSRVLTTGASPLWREDLMNNRGTPVIGLGQESPEYPDLPLQWMPHIQVADVAESARRALALGGRELVHHRDAAGTSQWAVLEDPSGAAFGIIAAVESGVVEPGAEGGAADPVGRIAWLDLTVDDAPLLRDFYTEVVGWSVEEVEMKDGGETYPDYALCTPDGTAVAGVCHARGVNSGIPPVWLIYLPVGDLDESRERVEREGGEILDARRGADGEVHFAIIRDPVGVCLALGRAG